MSWIYTLGATFFRVLFCLLTDRRVQGKENVPRHGPFLVVANHMNLTDPPLVAISIGRRPRFMAKKELFRLKPAAFILRAVGAFPVDRRRFDRATVRQAEETFARGLPLIMFPEATRSKNARLQPAFPGAAMLATRNSVPILPVGITGTERIRGAGWLLSRPRITVNIGKPFQLPLSDSRLTRDDLSSYTEIIMGNIATLLPIQYRGVYGGRGD
ncbi:MAG: 1-acyl-sn-glycerol-3-phosphate acyltransferase [Chloroflexi bacterium]|nr:1-acyl-sn-glycerol-3-phosphate acyltransferase [Chloroflexota bacterium]